MTTVPCGAPAAASSLARALVESQLTKVPMRHANARHDVVPALSAMEQVIAASGSFRVGEEGFE